MEKFSIPTQQVNVRLDKAIANQDRNLSRTMIQKLIEEQHILVNGRPQKASYKVALRGYNCHRKRTT